MTLLDNNTALICDAYKGCIWSYDLQSNKAEIWLQHPLLTRADETSPIPAANGIKLYNDIVFVSNTDKHLFITIPLKDTAAGTPEIFLDKVNIDDFAIDEAGTIYAATHIYNSVLKITPAKNITLIGEAEQGLTGSTAVAFGKTAADKNSIYVTTNGGMWLPPPEGVQPGKVIKMKVKP
jgi:sugar lactone lactonase YvrE